IVQDNTSVGVVVKRVVTTLQEEWIPCLESKDCANRPSTNDTVKSISGRESFAFAERQVVSAADVDRMANIKQRGPVAQMHVTQCERCNRTLPVVLGRHSQSMRPGVVSVELQTVPSTLTKIHL